MGGCRVALLREALFNYVGTMLVSRFALARIEARMKRIATSLFGLGLPTVGFAGQTVGYNPTEEMYLSAYIACNRSAANKIALYDGSEGQLAARAVEYCSSNTTN